MEETNSFRHTPSIRLLFVWCILIGLMVFISVESTKPFQADLATYEKPVYVANDLDVSSYLERMAYERVAERVQYRVMRSIAIVGIGLIGLFLMLKPGKIELDSETIKVYSRWMKKPYYHKKWVELSTIHIGVGQGVQGLFGHTGLHITYTNNYDAVQSEFISLSGYRASDDIQRLTRFLSADQVTLTEDDLQAEDISIKEMLSQGFKGFKTNYKHYYVYGIIFSVFAALQQYFKSSNVAMFASWAGIYFSFRALIGLYHHIYADYKDIETDFDKSWVYGEPQIGRMIGASFVLEFFMLVFIIGAISVMFIEISPFIQIVSLIIFGLLILFIYARLYFIPMIAAITPVGTSFIGMNNQLNKAFFKHKLLLSSIGLVKMILLAMVVWTYKENLGALTTLISKAAYVNIGLTFITAPYLGCCSVYCLKTLPMKEEVVEGGIALEEVIE